MKRFFLFFLVVVLEVSPSFSSERLDTERRESIRRIFQEQRDKAQEICQNYPTSQRENPSKSEDRDGYLKLVKTLRDYNGLEGLKNAIEEAHSKRDIAARAIFNREDFQKYFEPNFKNDEFRNAFFMKTLKLSIDDGKWVTTAVFDGMDEQITQVVEAARILVELESIEKEVEKYKQLGYSFS